ncbi:MAG: hydroxymethylbilane synthase [Chloroflexi bacterium]|nr:hydroxymethylbilane synthase [Chloroflexota bacterium]
MTPAGDEVVARQADGRHERTARELVRAANVEDIAIGSRGSALALAQASLVVEALARAGHSGRIVIIETEGDRRAPDSAWGEGAFVGAIERALLDGQVDVAVHSAKDVPTDEDPGLMIGAYLPRADPRDALVVRAGAEERRIDDLPFGSRVGTDSPRRTGFLLARRPDLDVHPLHGNVDTRLGRLDRGETDALVLACAGLDRLGLGGRIAERIRPEVVPPAPGQGAIAIQIRRDDPRMLALVAAVDHGPTRAAVEAERAFLAASGGGCRAPIGALAELEGGELILLGGYARPDGSATHVGRRRGSAADGAAVGHRLALDLESQLRHAATAIASSAGQATRPRLIVTRAIGQSDELMAALREASFEPIAVPAIAVQIDPPCGQLDAAAGLLHTYAWVVITSANGAGAILKAAERILTELGAPSWAVVGPATRSVLEHEGIEVQFQPTQSNGITLAVELPVAVGERVLVVRGDLADGELALALRARGADVDDVVAYRTREAPESSRVLLCEAIGAGPIAAAVFTSGSTVRGLVALGRAASIDVTSIPSICIGPETAAEARTAGFRVLAVAPSPDSAALVAAAGRALVPQTQEIP